MNNPGAITSWKRNKSSSNKISVIVPKVPKNQKYFSFLGCLTFFITREDKKQEETHILQSKIPILDKKPIKGLILDADKGLKQFSVAITDGSLVKWLIGIPVIKLPTYTKAISKIVGIYSSNTFLNKYLIFNLVFTYYYHYVECM